MRGGVDTTGLPGCSRARAREALPHDFTGCAMISFVNDSLTNLVAGLGAEKDKASHDRFALRSLSEPEIDALYNGEWIAKKIVDCPVDDMFRAWRTWQAPAAAVTAFEEAEKRHGVKVKVAKAVRLARIYGGAAIVIGADVADPLKPLDPRAVKRGKLEYLTVHPRRRITAGPLDMDPASPTYDQPAHYTLTNGAGGMTRLHPSRVIRFVGAERYDAAGEADGWGFSALQAPYEAVHHAALATSAAASMLHEAKVDVINVHNLESALQSPEGTAALQRRFSLANMMKSLNNMLLLGKDETYTRTQTAFAGVPQLLERFMAVAAAAADIPAARFLAQSASGLNASGAADVRNYYDRLASDRARDLTPVLERLDAILWRDATGNAAPDAAVFTWDSLWQPTEKERTDNANGLADAVTKLVNAALLPEEALRVGVQNALIETGVFPGLEQALASAIVEADPDSEDDTEEPASPPADNPARAAVASGRDRLAALVRDARERRGRGGAITRH